MDNPKNMSKLALLGATASHIQIQAQHFPDQFDV